MAMPPEGGQMTTKLKGGIGVLAEHLRDLFIDSAGEMRFRAKVEQILVEDGKVTGVRLKDGEVITAPIVVSNLAPETTLLDLVGAAVRGPLRLPQRAGHADVGGHVRFTRRAAAPMGDVPSR
jgi:phytoene dehydrogenase-like protein